MDAVIFALFQAIRFLRYPMRMLFLRY